METVFEQFLAHNTRENKTDREKEDKKEKKNPEFSTSGNQHKQEMENLTAWSSRPEKQTKKNVQLHYTH